MDLYRQQVLDHYHTPRNFGLQPQATAQASSFNPLCGDRVTIQLDLEKDTVATMRFEGTGCAISMAAASLLSEYVVGHSADDLKQLDATIMQALLGVALSPVRLKCALLPLKTLQQALTTK